MLHVSKLAQEKRDTKNFGKKRLILNISGLNISLYFKN